MQQFYMCYSHRHGRDEVVPFVEEHDVGLLTNATARWSDITERFNEMWNYDAPTVVDSGGYNVQARYADRDGNLKEDPEVVEDELSKDAPFYPWTVEEYHDWLHEEGEELDWAASMDYACEERFDPIWSVRERIEATIENTIRQHEMMERDDSDYTLLPVLQGRTVDQYVECVERYQEAGIDTTYVGLGTVCRLSSSKEIVRIENELRERTDVEKIHGFGVKIDAYRMGATFDTADTQAWVYNHVRGNISILNRKDDDVKLEIRLHDGADYERKVHGFKAYYAYVTYEVHGREDLVDEIIEDQKEIDYGPKPKARR